MSYPTGIYSLKQFTVIKRFKFLKQLKFIKGFTVIKHLTVLKPITVAYSYKMVKVVKAFTVGKGV